MATATNDDHGDHGDLIRRYLLGELPEPEADELELALLSDRQDLFLLAEAVEADLLVDYARDRLTPAERQRLESGVLATPGGRDRLALARALAAQAADERANREPARVLPFWRRTLRTVTAVPARHRKAVAAAAVALVATNITLLATNPWLVQPPQPVVPVHPPVFPSQPSSVPDGWEHIGDTERQERSHDNPAQLPSMTPPPAPPEPVVTQPVVVQLAGATRGDDSALVAEIGPANGAVEIQMPVTYESHETFRFTVRNAADDTVVTQQEIAAGPVDGEGMRIASLTLPAASLPDGNYVIEVSGLKAGEEPLLIANSNLEVVRTR